MAKRKGHLVVLDPASIAGKILAESTQIAVQNAGREFPALVCRKVEMGAFTIVAQHAQLGDVHIPLSAVALIVELRGPVEETFGFDGGGDGAGKKKKSARSGGSDTGGKTVSRGGGGDIIGNGKRPTKPATAGVTHTGGSPARKGTRAVDGDRVGNGAPLKKRSRGGGGEVAGNGAPRRKKTRGGGGDEIGNG